MVGASRRFRSSRTAAWGSALLAFACLTMTAPGGRADPVPGRLALVVGESAYSKLPPLPGCTVSSQGMAERLRQLGFDVTERADASNGMIGAALIDLARRVAAAPGSTVAVYFCGYAAAFEDRVFLLPVTAVLDRASDVLTQGLPAQSLVDLGGRNTRASLAVLDTFDMPGSSPGANAALASFVQAQAASAGHFVLAATEAASGTTATPLSQSLSAILAKPPVDLSAAAGAIRQDLAGSGVGFEAAGGGRSTLLAPPVTPSPPPAAAPEVQPPAAAPEPAPPAPVPQIAPSAPAPVAPAVVMPEEEQYTLPDRRRVQAALRQLGYYDGAVDGVIGPDTRAAIRRYQHELGVPMTGRLTAAQATRLVAGSAQQGGQGPR